MSENTDNSPPESKTHPAPDSASPADPTAAPSVTKAKKPKKPKKPGRWRRRFLVAATTLVVVIILFRVLLSLLLPWTLRRVAREYGLDCTYERSDLYLFSGDAGLWHVRITQLDDGSPVALADYCRADISPLQLFRGALVVQRLETDGVELTLQRNADGTIPLLKRLLSGATKPVPKAVKPTAIDFTPPVAIDALRLSHVRTHIIDKAVQPALDTHVELDLRFSDLASPVRPARLTVQVLPCSLLDSVIFEAEGTSNSTQLDAKFQFSARGLHPLPMAEYLAPFGVHATGDGLTARASGSIHTNVVPGKSDQLTGNIKLQDMAVTADGEPSLTLRALTVDLGTLRPGSAEVTRVVLEDGIFAASRTLAGGFRVAGLEWSPDAPAAAASPVPVSPPLSSNAAAKAPVTVAPAATPPFVWSVGEVTLKQFRASFKDQRVKPATELQFRIDDVTLKGIVGDPGKPDAPVSIVGRFSAPGVAEKMTLDGSCRPFALKKTVELGVKAERVRPDAMRPYFQLAGIESDLQAGTFTCRMTADVTMLVDVTTGAGAIVANATLADVLWVDKAELLSLGQVKVTGLGLAEGSIRVDAIDVNGPRFNVKREASGALWAAGFRRLPASPVADSSSEASAPHASAAANNAAAPAPSDPLANLPKLDIGRFTWHGVQIHVDDEAAPSAATKVFIRDAGIELTDIHADFGPTSTPLSRGHVRAWLKAPGLAGELMLEGTVTQVVAGLSAELELKGENLSADLTAPYLKPLGIEPTLRDGSLAASLHVDFTRKQTKGKADQYHANVKASNVRFADAGTEMFGIDHADVTNIDYKPGLLEVGDVTLANPRGQFVREESGAIRALGIRLLPKREEPKKSAFVVAPPVKGTAAVPRAADSAFRQVSGVSTAAPATSQPASSQPSLPPDVLVLRQFTLTGGAFAWTDQAVTPAAQTVAQVKGQMQGLTWGRPADPAKIAFTIKADGFVDDVTIKGLVSAAPASGAAKLTLSASGLRQGKLASYLPPGVTVEMKDGRFDGELDASAALDEKGGMSAKATLSGLSLRDGPNGPPLFHLDSANVAISKLDIPAGVVAIDEISAFGAETSARQSADGALHAVGVALGKPATQPSAPAQAPAAPAMPPPASQPASSPTAPPAVAAPAVAPPPPIAGRLVLEKRKFPLVTVKKVDLNLRRFAFTDEARVGTPPIVVSNLRFFSARPIEALGDDPSSRAPIDLSLTLRVDNVIESVNFTAQLTPFASQPTVQFDLKGAGVRGDGLLAQLPELKSDLDGSPLTDGQFHIHGEAQIKIDRLDPIDFSMKRGLVCDFLVKGLEFRGTKDGPVLAGIDEIRSEGVEIRPDKGTVRVRTLEVNKIVGQAALENDGLHVAGIVVKVPGLPTTQPAVAAKPSTQGSAVASTTKTPSPSSGKPVASTSPTVPSPHTAPPDAGEISIGKVVVSGIDFSVEDRTVPPKLLVPLNQLDLDIRDLSTRAFEEDRKMRFSLLVGAGKVPLPRRTQQGAAGMMKDAAALLGGKKIDTKVVIEERDLFSQVQADGVLSFFPHPSGWLKASVSAFDLAALKSEAKRNKVDLNNGVFDTTVEARLPGDGSMMTRSHFTFTDLELQEPPNGPIMRFVHPPPPFDTLDLLLAALRDQEGSIDVPLNIPVKQGHLATSDIVAAGLGAFGAILTKAALAAPLKAAGAAKDVLGAFVPGMGHGKKSKKVHPVVLTFTAGDTAVPPSSSAKLAALLKRMKEPNVEVTLRHELGDGDVARAEERANPSPEECSELVSRLDRRKQELQRTRAELSGRARSDLASRPPAEAAGTLERLRGVERDLAATEDALDRIYDLLRPGADRQAGRRTRQAALEVGHAREQSVRAAMIASGVPAIDSRIHLTRPQYNPAGDAGGKVEIVVTVKKKR